MLDGDKKKFNDNYIKILYKIYQNNILYYKNKQKI